MRGYVDVGGDLVRWRGLTAAYTVAERSVMRSMPVREQAIVHTLKAFTQGEIASSDLETVGAGNGESRATEAGVTPGEAPRVATDTSRGRGEDCPVDRTASPDSERGVGDFALGLEEPRDSKSSTHPALGSGPSGDRAGSIPAAGTYIDPEDIAFGKPAPRVVHNKREPFDVYIGRPSKWGNPFSHKPGTLAEFMVASRDEAIDAYADWIKTQPLLLSSLSDLRNKTLGCWCAPQRCHGDVLLALANKPRRRPVYALVWTWRRHRVVKTKALGTRKMRAWKKWHERQGWKVISHGDGYFASKGQERHVISLHEYDRDTNERLK